MLFTPWRDEVIDLLKDCDTYKERYNQLKSMIAVHKASYKKNSAKINKTVQDAKKDTVLQHWYEMVAPSTEHAQQKDQSLPTTDSKIYPDCDTHKERYNQLKSVIAIHKASYKKNSAEINKAVQDAKRILFCNTGTK